jgi:hypothetical protein
MKEAISSLRPLKDLFPIGKDKARIEKALEEAEQQGKFAELRIAQALGFQLCRCTSPPQVMLGIDYRRTERSQESFQCPNCKRIWPPDRPSPRRAAVDYGSVSF